MLLKMTPITATTLGLVDNTNIADLNLQIVTVRQLQDIVNQLIVSGIALDQRVSEMGINKVKMLLIKWFSNKKIKLRGFLI